MRTISFALVLLTALGGGRLSTAEPAALLRELGIDASERLRLRDGVIRSTGLPESTPREVAAAAVMWVPHPPAVVVRTVQEGAFFTHDRDYLDGGLIVPAGEGAPAVTAANTPGDSLHAALAGLDRVGYGPRETGELTGLLRVRPGDRFNFSALEIERFQAAAAAFRPRDVEWNPAVAESMSACLRAALQDRARAYATGGLSAVAPYARADGSARSPRDELAAALAASRHLAAAFPDAHRALARYPLEQPADATHALLWLKLRVQSRPVFVLAHRMAIARPEATLLTERQYYVGRAYNAMLIVMGFMPMEEGTLVFYVNRTSTDQVDVVGGRIARAIGRRMQRAQYEAAFRALQVELQRPPAP